MQVPKYRKRRDRDSAYVQISGRRLSLPGRIDSPESLEAYRRAVDQFLRDRASREKPTRRRPLWDLRVEDLVLAWLDHCQVYYRGTANTASNEYDNCRYAVRPLVALYGGSALVDFRADELKAVREAMISGGWDEPDPEHPEKRRARSWSRGHANACINKLKRLFRWGLEHDYVPAENAAMIGAVPPLKKGRTTARELPPVHPVAEQVIDATLPHLPPVVWAMVELQRITGMRSDNLCSMRPCDVDRAAPVWIYRPAAHKESHADKELLVPLGPRAQAILQPYLERPANMPCFSPREAPNRKPTGKRGPGTRYNARSYCHAVYKGCDRAGVPRWHPHQLRHNAAIAAKSARGVEGARAYLGTR